MYRRIDTCYDLVRIVAIGAQVPAAKRCRLRLDCTAASKCPAFAAKTTKHDTLNCKRAIVLRLPPTKIALYSAFSPAPACAKLTNTVIKFRLAYICPKIRI